MSVTVILLDICTNSEKWLFLFGVVGRRDDGRSAVTEVLKRKLIEVSLPLKAINRESAREKSIRHGHPSTIHPWWARRPLAACRAVLFAQLVDDPSSFPDRFPTETEQSAERKRLHDIIEELVVWENAGKEAVLAKARAEISKSLGEDLPTITDPFAGGGSIPLEAQRLGLVAHASDLNPVAVLINKALIEIPPVWAGRPPVFPGAARSRKGWPGATGLAEDVRRYGEWMRHEVEKRLGHMYPMAKLPDGAVAPVIAWIWARTVRCPNPACGIRMPLVRSWWLGKKEGRETYVVPSVVDGRVEFAIGHDLADAPSAESDGTIRRTGAVCVGCGEPAPLSYVRAEGKAKRMGAHLMAIAAKGNRRRIYLPPSDEHVMAADVPRPDDTPDGVLADDPRNVWCFGYGLEAVADLFTNRQLAALTTVSDMVQEVHANVLSDALAAGRADNRARGLAGRGARAYADSVATYLALAVSRITSTNSALCRWNPHATKESVSDASARHAIPMVWDYAEGRPLTEGPCDLQWSVGWVARVLDNLVVGRAGSASQADAARVYKPAGTILSTDPPYYDNVSYAVLSDFNYVWLRRAVGHVHPKLFSTVLTPKADELIADPVRHGGKEQAAEFFRDRFEKVFTWLRRGAPSNIPISVYYAYRQSETTDLGEVSTGWETLLEAMMRAGWTVRATWPIQTERGGRMRDIGSNALASSIVLACRPRPETAGGTDRRGFIAELRHTLPGALRAIQESSIAPVDLAQAAIGPGMAIYSGYARVTESDGSPMRVRTALALINQVLAEVLTEQEGDLDQDSRFALKWFEQHAWGQGTFGDAENMAKAYNTSVSRLERIGIFSARAGKARLAPPEDAPTEYRSTADRKIVLWEVLLQVIKRLEGGGIDSAAEFMAHVVPRVPNATAVKDLAYLLYAICERRKWSKQALRFNGLVTSWPDLLRSAHNAKT